METTEFQPFENTLLVRIKQLQDFTIVTRNAIEEITGMPRLVRVLARTSKKHEEKIKPAEELAKFAKAEIDTGFATLYGMNVVLLWGALESSMRDFLVVWLIKYKEARQIKEIAKLRVRIGEYDSLDSEDRMRYVLGLLERDNASTLRPGIARFTQLLHFLGIVPELNDDTKNNLLEMASVRNVIVHHAGVVDQRFLNLCPNSGFSLGDEIRITSKQLDLYVGSIADFVAAVVEAVQQVEYFRPDNQPAIESWQLSKPKVMRMDSVDERDVMSEVEFVASSWSHRRTLVLWFTVIERGANKKDVWHRIGAMWKGKSGGYLLKLHSLPLEGKIIAMPPKENEAVEE